MTEKCLVLSGFCKQWASLFIYWVIRTNYNSSSSFSLSLFHQQHTEIHLMNAHLWGFFNYATSGQWLIPSICVPPFVCFIISSLCLGLLGNIKNTEPLDSKHQRVHTFWVTAFDCGKNRAQADAQVVITVKPSCKPGWMGRYPCFLFPLDNAPEDGER